MIFTYKLMYNVMFPDSVEGIAADDIPDLLPKDEGMQIFNLHFIIRNILY